MSGFRNGLEGTEIKDTVEKLAVGCWVLWYTLVYARGQPAPQPHSSRAAAGHQHQLPQGSLYRAEASDHRDGHLRPSDRVAPHPPALRALPLPARGARARVRGNRRCNRPITIAEEKFG